MTYFLRIFDALGDTVLPVQRLSPRNPYGKTETGEPKRFAQVRMRATESCVVVGCEIISKATGKAVTTVRTDRPVQVTQGMFLSVNHVYLTKAIADEWHATRHLHIST